MIKQAELVEVKEEGLIKLLGQNVTFFCMNYFYTGELIGVNETCILLKEPKIIYETGSFSDSNWKDVQRVCDELYIQISLIEAFGKVK